MLQILRTNRTALGYREGNKKNVTFAQLLHRFRDEIKSTSTKQFISNFAAEEKVSIRAYPAQQMITGGNCP